MKKLLATFAVAMVFSMPAMAVQNDYENPYIDLGWANASSDLHYDAIEYTAKTIQAKELIDKANALQNLFTNGEVIFDYDSMSIKYSDGTNTWDSEELAKKVVVYAAHAWELDRKYTAGELDLTPIPATPIPENSVQLPPKPIKGNINTISFNSIDGAIEIDNTECSSDDLNCLENVVIYESQYYPDQTLFTIEGQTIDITDNKFTDTIEFSDEDGEYFLLDNFNKSDINWLMEYIGAYTTNTVQYTDYDGAVAVFTYDGDNEWVVNEEQTEGNVKYLPGEPDTISISTVDFDPDTKWGEALKGFNPAFPATSTIGPYSFDEAYQKVLRHKYWAKQKDRDLIWYSSYNEATKRLAEDQTNVKSKGTKFSINGEWYNLTKESGRLAFLKQSTKGIETDAGMIAKIKNQKYVFSGDTWRNVNSKVKKSFDYGDALDIQDAAIAIGYATLEYNEPTWWGSNGTLKFTGNGLDSMNFVTMDSRQLKNAITDIVNETYKDGYDDGYEDGFADGHKIGYDKGWHDAKADNAYNN